MEKYEVGGVYEIQGQKRKVLAVEPELVTTTYLDYKEPVDTSKMTLDEAKSEAEKTLEEAEEKARAIKAEAEKTLEEAKRGADTLKAKATAPNYKKMVEYIPLDKCNKEQLMGIGSLTGTSIVPGMSNDEIAAAIKK